MFAIIGSANCSRASYTFIPEANVGVADENSHSDRGSFAHELRIGLWLKHLNGPGFNAFKKSHVADFMKASIYWRFPQPGSFIEPYYVDHDKRLKDPNLGAADDIGALRDWASGWDLSDPDGSVNIRLAQPPYNERRYVHAWSAITRRTLARDVPALVGRTACVVTYHPNASRKAYFPSTARDPGGTSKRTVSFVACVTSKSHIEKPRSRNLVDEIAAATIAIDTSRVVGTFWDLYQA